MARLPRCDDCFVFVRQCPTSVLCWQTVCRPQQPLQGGLMLRQHHGQQPCTQGPHDVQACCPSNTTAACPDAILHCCCAGIAAAELALMSSKSRTQLLQALLQRQTPTPKDMPQGLALQPLTATCWAAAAWQEVCPTDASSVRPAGRRGGGAAAAGAGGDWAYNGFDLCIGDGTMYEGGEAANICRASCVGGPVLAAVPVCVCSAAPCVAWRNIAYSIFTTPLQHMHAPGSMCMPTCR